MPGSRSSRRAASGARLAIAASWGFAWAAGWAVSAQRAALMATALALARTSGRPALTWNNWSLAAALIALAEPAAVRSAGYQLFFGAVRELGGRPGRIGGQFFRERPAQTLESCGNQASGLLIKMRVVLLAPEIAGREIPVCLLLGSGPALRRRRELGRGEHARGAQIAGQQPAAPAEKHRRQHQRDGLRQKRMHRCEQAVQLLPGPLDLARPQRGTGPGAGQDLGVFLPHRDHRTRAIDHRGPEVVQGTPVNRFSSARRSRPCWNPPWVRNTSRMNCSRVLPERRFTTSASMVATSGPRR